MASSSSTAAETTTERRGIPGAQFVEDVETYLTQSGLDVNSSLSFLQERYFLLSLYRDFNGFMIFHVFGDWYCGFCLFCRLQQYKLVEMKLLAQQRDLQVLLCIL